MANQAEELKKALEAKKKFDERMKKVAEDLKNERAKGTAIQSK